MLPRQLVLLLLLVLACATPLAADRQGPPAAAGLEVRGTILDQDGDPLGGVAVSLSPVLDAYRSGLLTLEGHARPAPVAAVRTDGNGRFSLPAPDRGVWAVAAEAEGRLAMSFQPLVLVADREVPPVRLVPSQELLLILRDAAGDPLADTWVHAQRDGERRLWHTEHSGWRPAFRSGRTDAAGHVSLPRTPDETLEVTVLPREAVPETRVDPPPGPWRLASQESRLRRLRVIGPDGRPVPGALVRAGDRLWPMGITGDDGGIPLTAPVDRDLPVLLLGPDGARLRTSVSPAGTAADQATLTLPRARRLKGRLLSSSSHQPVADGLVWPALEPARFARSDAEGRYSLTAPVDEPFGVQAEAAGFVPTRGWISKTERAAGRAESLALTPAVALQGVVVDPAGSPVPGASVAAILAVPPRRRPFDSLDPADGRGIAERDGKFRLHGLLPDARYELLATAPGFTPVRRVLATPAPPLRPQAPRLVMLPARSAFGRVLDLAERPVAGAAVRLSPHGSPTAARDRPDDPTRDPFAILSGPDGRFSVAQAPAAEVDVEIRRAGFAPMTVRGLSISPTPSGVDLGTFVLVAGAPVAGRVVDGNGEPVAGARVWAVAEEIALWKPHRRTADPGAPGAVTDETGRFVLGDLRAGALRDLLVRAEGFRDGTVSAVEAPSEEPVTVVLEAAASLAGRVVDAAGEGIPDARVHLTLYELLADVEREIGVGVLFDGSVSTSGDGRFHFPSLEPGKGGVTVEAAGFISSPAPVEVAAGRAAEGLEIVLERGATVEGQVLTSDGEPVAEARVTIQGAGGFSDAEGLYRFEGVPIGPGSARVSHPRYRRQTREVEIEPGVNTLDWTLPPGHEVSGVVVDSGDAPIGGAVVRLQTEESYDGRAIQGISGADGAFLLDPVPSDEYRLIASAEGFAEAELPRPVVVADEALHELRITLRPAGAIHGRILGLDLDELAEVRVEATLTGDGRTARGMVDWQGSYEIPDLVPGDWVVTASLARSRRRIEARVPVAGGGDARRDLEFTEGTVLSGSVVADGTALPNAVVSVRGLENALERSVRTDHQGGFRIADLEPGTYWLGVTHRRRRIVYNGSLDLLADREVHLDVSAATVQGTVLDGARGTPVPGAYVALRRSDGLPGAEGVISVRSDEAGVLFMPRVSAGPYSLTVRKDGYATLERVLEVRAPHGGETLELVLEPTPGLSLLVRTASGTVPSHCHVLATDPSGRTVLTEIRRVDPNGLLRLATLPPGTWRLALSAPGGALTTLEATAPGGPVPVVLQEGATVEVLIPDLRSSNLVATLQAFGAEGEALRALDPSVGLRSAWPVVAGRARLEGVPAGAWNVLAEAPDGRSWTTTVISPGSGELQAVFRSRD